MRGLLAILFCGLVAAGSALSGELAVKARLNEAYQVLPLSFEGDGAGFFARGPGYQVAVSAAGVELSRGEARVQVKLAAARAGTPGTGLEELPGKVNYYIGNDRRQWRTGVPTFAKVRYEGVYPGVDVVYYGNQRRLEYDLVVAPGADPGSIELAFEGVKAVRLESNGDLVLCTREGELRQHKPRVFQDLAGERKEIAGRYVIREGNRVGFAVEDYDSSRALVIDPVLSYSTYLGGGAADTARAMAVDGEGRVYLTGITGSTNFPLQNAVRSTQGGRDDVFVAKFNASLSGLVYATYLGGSGIDEGRAIAVDSSGNAYVAGGTLSANFPTEKPLQASYGGGWDVFATKLDPDGKLVYSTFIGGKDTDIAQAAAVDASGALYLTGYSYSDDFPTRNPFQARKNPGTCNFAQWLFWPCGDAIVLKLDPAGSRLEYSTYLGGSGDPNNFFTNGDDTGMGIVVDSAGQALVTGTAHSTNFPTTSGAYATNLAGYGFLTKFSATGNTLLFSTYVPSEPNGVAVDPAGNIYLAGTVREGELKPTAGVFQTAYGGGNFDACVMKFNPTGQTLLYASHLGGSGNDEASDIAVDGAGSAYVVGYTTSSSFPRTDAVQAAFGGQQDAFLSKVNPTGTALVHSTTLGGSGDEEGRAVALDRSGNVYVAGSTKSMNFPITQSGLRTSNAGDNDAFLVKLGNAGYTPAVSVTSVSAASYSGAALAPECLASAYGQGLATTTQGATALPLPTSLGQTTVKVTDAAGVERLAPLFFVSPGQINYVVPAGTSSGQATITVTAGDGKVSVGRVLIEPVAPGLFSANFDGRGVAAALAVRVVGGTQQTALIFRWDEGQKKNVAVPIDLGSEGDQVILLLFGTGIRYRSGLAGVKAVIGGENAEVLYAGLQPESVGLDQVNVRLPRSLIGRGEVNVVLTVDGRVANTVTVMIGGR